MRVFFLLDAMPRLNLPWGNTTFSLSLSLSPAHTHTHTHLVSDMLTFPDRHLSLSLCGCKVFSPRHPSPERQQTCSHARTCSISHLAGAARVPASQRGWIRIGENCGQGEEEESTVLAKHAPTRHHCCTITGLQSFSDRTSSQCFQLHLRMCYWTAFRKENKC